MRNEEFETLCGFGYSAHDNFVTKSLASLRLRVKQDSLDERHVA